MQQLVPAAEQLSPTLIAFAKLAPEAKGFFKGLSPVIDAAPTGFPALRKLFRDDFPPLLRAVDPFLRNLNPLLTGLNLYKREFTSFFANVAAVTNGELTTENASGEKSHFLRVMGPLGPESLATYPSRLTTNRNSAYSPPRGEGPRLGPAQVRYPPVQLRHHRVARPVDPQQPGLPGTNQKRRTQRTKTSSTA